MSDTRDVILVDHQDQAVGTMEKMEAHRQGLLHRAFSIFLFNDEGKMLLQQRALHKYHSGGLWTNACCSHPSPGQTTIEAAHVRLMEELNIDTDLQKDFDFLYRAEFTNGLIEHEFDHVFSGNYSGEIPFNQEEVMAVRYASWDEISLELQHNPDMYTAWFHLAFEKIRAIREKKRSFFPNDC